MRKYEARDILTRHNLWRRGEGGDYIRHPTPMEVGQAIDIITQPNEMANTIRQAAINWPQFLGDVESNVIDAFCNTMDWPVFDTDQGLTFMLFVAEALE